MWEAIFRVFAKPLHKYETTCLLDKFYASATNILYPKSFLLERLEDWTKTPIYPWERLADDSEIAYPTRPEYRIVLYQLAPSLFGKLHGPA